MTGTIRYCRGCNQRFVAAGDDARCPQCRQPMTTCDVAPTLALAETLTGGLAEEAGSTEEIATSLIGRRFDAYTIEAFVGRGGMASVFRARHNTLFRPCAIKVLSPELRRRDSTFLDMFLAEARAAASVVHPHIVTVHNIGRAEGYHYIELEYVAGQPLQRIVQAERRLDPLRATNLLKQACQALAEAHRSGLIHRDFKPSNILVGPGDRAKLADFGLAKRIAAEGGGHSAESLTGTPYFMAPELFEGESATCRSDVYAVGASYYYLLTGQFPYVDQNLASLAQKHATAPIPDPRTQCSDLAAAAVDVLQRCLAKRAADRFPDGAALYEQLCVVQRRLRDIHALIAEAVGQLDATWQAEQDRGAITVRLPQGRSQRVYVEETVSGPWSEELVKIYSPCCPVDEGYLRRALELNAHISHGSLAIEQVDGKPFFVMMHSYPRATCDTEEIQRSVQDVATWADEVERALTGDDVR